MNNDVNELLHYGVKGMKWRTSLRAVERERNSEPSNRPASTTATLKKGVGASSGPPKVEEKKTKEPNKDEQEVVDDAHEPKKKTGIVAVDSGSMTKSSGGKSMNETYSKMLSNMSERKKKKTAERIERMLKNLK